MKAYLTKRAILAVRFAIMLSFIFLVLPVGVSYAYGVESQDGSSVRVPIELPDAGAEPGSDTPASIEFDQTPVDTGSDDEGPSAEVLQTPHTEDANGSELVVMSAMSDDLLDNASDIADLISDTEEPPAANVSRRYYYDQLDDVERALYRKAASLTLDTPSFTVCGLNAEQAGKMLGDGGKRWLTALLADSPRYHMMWERYCDVSGSEDEGVVTVTLHRMPCATEYTIAKSEARIRQIVANVGDEPDPYVRYRKLATYLTRDMEFDGGSVFASGIVFYLNDCASGPLTRNSAVCAGFADLLKILCDELDIPCVITGNAGHAWNLVEMGGAWYHTDVTAYAAFDAFAEDGSSLPEISQLLEDGGVLLFGTGSYDYTSNDNYFISDPYLAQEDDFTFPEASAGGRYEYQGTYDVTYEEHDLDFEEPATELTYAANDDGTTCTVTGFEGRADGPLSIPGELDGLVVTGIGDSAFVGSGFEGELDLADSITAIGASAFRGCTGLTSVRWPTALKVIGWSAFNGCTGLVGGLELPEGLVRIEDNAFYYCTGLTGPVTLPEGLEYLGQLAFWECTSLGGTIRIPDHAEVGFALANYSRVEGFEVGDGCDRYTTVDGMLFDKGMTTLLLCPATKSGDLAVPEGVTEIARFACQGCRGLDGELTLPTTLKTVGEGAFRDCSFTGALRIPDGVESIGDLAFFYAYNADRSGEVTLPDSLGSVGESAFGGNGFTGDLVIPQGLKELPEYCFGFNHFDGVLELPDGLLSIGPFCFYDSTFTNSIDLSDGSVLLSESAFAGAQFPGFKCDCGVETQQFEDEKGFWTSCNHCGGVSFVPSSGPEIGSVKTQASSVCAGEAFTVEAIVRDESWVSGGYVKVKNTSLDPADNGAIRQADFFNAGGDKWVATFSVDDDWTKGVYALYEVSFLDSVGNNTQILPGGEPTEEYPDVVTIGHNWETVLDRPATCAEEGSESVRCSLCGQAKEGSERAVARAEHAWGEWAVTRQPTCTEAGSRERVCSACGERESGDVAPSGHEFPEGYTLDRPATCAEEGSESVRCSLCGQAKEGSERAVARAEHAWGGGKTTKAATYTAPGIRTFVCKSCGATKTEEIPVLKRTSMAGAVIKSLTTYAYAGKALTPKPKVIVDGKTLKAGTDYTLTYKNNVNVGTATVTVVGKGGYIGKKSATFKIAKAKNPAKVTVRDKVVKGAAVKNKSQIVAPITVSKAQGKVTYAKVEKGSSKLLTVNKQTGKITLKKGAKMGTYTVKVKVSVAGNKSYKPLTKTVTAKIKVK